MKKGDPDPDRTLLAKPKNSVDDGPYLAARYAPEHKQPLTASSQVAEHDLKPGTVVKERFVIHSILGRGGMGVVYRATDLRKEEAQDRDTAVALKVLNDEFRQNPHMTQALQREARKAQSLAHPSIATVYDFDRDDDMVFMTMEMLDGQPLDKVILDHAHGMPKEEVAPLIRGLCLGLAYAHNKNIVHSDFKPANVFLTSDKKVKILDFGIARAVPMANADTSDVTRFDAGDLGALTPSYAANEMWLGADPHPSDDVYALAIVTYELLTGRHPFDGASAPDAKARRLKPAHIPHLHHREWRAIQHGLVFNREERTAHAADFLREFEGTPKIRIFFGVTAVTLALALGYLAFQEYEAAVASMPDFVFESLPIGVQQDFHAHMRDARAFEGFGDVASALGFYIRAYELHPRNKDAVQGIDQIVSLLLEAALESNNKDDLSILKTNVDAIMEVDDYLARQKALLEAKNEIEKRL